jgi:protein-tyrosine sulfotransferase
MTAAEAPPPILILSCYRSGSTLLRFIVDTHPEIYSPPEVFLGQAAYFLAHFALSLRGLREKKMEGLTTLAPDVLAWIRSNLEGEMRAAAARKGKRLWCEKTPSNLVPDRLGILRQVFPDARYLCLYRHPLDVAQSMIKMIDRFEDVQPFLIRGGVGSATINYWNQRTATLLELEEALPTQCHRLRYEDLVADPPRVLAPMFRFLGVDWDESLLPAVFETEHDPGLADHYIPFTRAIHNRSLGAGRHLSLKGVADKSLDTMRTLLQKLGYAELSAAASPATAAAANAARQDLRWLFETHLPARLRGEPELCDSLAGTFQFVVTSEEGGAWVVDPRQRRVAAGPGAASCGIEVSAADLFAIAHGELHPWKAGEQRRLRLSGSVRVQDLQKLMQLLSLPKA